MKGAELAKKANWTKSDGSTWWTPKDGFDGDINKVILESGTRIDRFGYDDGYFVAPEGTLYTSRSRLIGTDTKTYTVFEVLKPVEVNAGKTVPWFGEAGGGIQYQFNEQIFKLLDDGILRKVGN